MTRENFDEQKNSIKIYRKEVNEKSKSIIEQTNKIQRTDDIGKVIEFVVFAEKVADFIDIMWKLVNAQDKYIEELEKIVDRMM